VRCAEIRDRLSTRQGEGSPGRREPRWDAEIAAHRESCAACARYAARLDQARAIFARESEITPGPGFARRVVARLPSSAQVLGWAALRALPAAIALALAIGLFGLFQAPSAESPLLEDDTSSEVLLTYAAMPPEGQVTPVSPQAPAMPRAPIARSAEPR
jgi:hypothetical protein